MDNYNKFYFEPKLSKKQFIVKTTAYKKSECCGFKHVKNQKRKSLSAINIIADLKIHQ